MCVYYNRSISIGSGYTAQTRKFCFYSDYDTTAGIYILYIVLCVHTPDPNIRYELRTTEFIGTVWVDGREQGFKGGIAFGVCVIT